MQGLGSQSRSETHSSSLGLQALGSRLILNQHEQWRLLGELVLLRGQVPGFQRCSVINKHLRLNGPYSGTLRKFLLAEKVGRPDSDFNLFWHTNPRVSQRCQTFEMRWYSDEHLCLRNRCRTFSLLESRRSPFLFGLCIF